VVGWSVEVRCFFLAVRAFLITLWGGQGYLGALFGALHVLALTVCVWEKTDCGSGSGSRSPSR